MMIAVLNILVYYLFICIIYMVVLSHVGLVKDMLSKYLEVGGSVLVAREV